jgi:hypothetical protein
MVKIHILSKIFTQIDNSPHARIDQSTMKVMRLFPIFMLVILGLLVALTHQMELFWSLWLRAICMPICPFHLEFPLHNISSGEQKRSFPSIFLLFRSRKINGNKIIIQNTAQIAFSQVSTPVWKTNMYLHFMLWSEWEIPTVEISRHSFFRQTAMRLEPKSLSWNLA